MIKHYSWHIKKHWLTKQSWGSGVISARQECVVYDQNLHKVQWQIFPEVHIKPTCLTMTKARPSAAFQRSCQSTHLFCKNTRCSTTGQFNTWIKLHFYFKSFNHWTPNLAILFGKPFDCFKCLPQNQTPFQNSDIDRFGSKVTPLENWAKLFILHSPDFYSQPYRFCARCAAWKKRASSFLQQATWQI